MDTTIMRIRISARNPKVIFAEGNVFDEKFYRIFNLDVLAPFIRHGFNIQTETFMKFEKFDKCIFKPFKTGHYIKLDETQAIVNNHLNSLLDAGHKRIAICPVPIEDLRGTEADKFYMECIYKWMENHEKEIENLFIIDISTKSNLIEQDI